LYNWLCDQEWNTPTGEIEGCGGIAMFRAAAFEQVDGFGRILLLVKIPNSIFGCENPA